MIYIHVIHGALEAMAGDGSPALAGSAILRSCVRAS
jgi:hypothetical protein